MKKIDILGILEDNKQIYDLQKLVNYTIYKNMAFGFREKEEKYWLRNLMDFPEERQVLINEIKEAKRKYEEAVIDKKICSHDIIISTIESDGLCLRETYECAICEKKLNLNELNSNKNKDYVFIKNNMQFDGDYWHQYEKGMGSKEIIECIYKILENYNPNEEVDLIKEFSLLKLKNKDIIISSTPKTLTKQKPFRKF